MFELKKIISVFLMPMPFLLLLGFLGLALIWFTSFRRTGATLTSLSLFSLLLVSFYPFTSSLLFDYERQYSRFLPPTTPVNYVMVLGHGHVVDDDLPPTAELSRTALMRLAEGIRIHFMYPSSKLVLSGYDGGTQVSHARMLAEVAMALGVNQNSILLLETAQDTKEEAQQAAKLLTGKNVVLVTSASHMKRALAEFEAQNIHPIPAPTDFMAQKEIHQPWAKYAPKSEYLQQFEVYWHEQLGALWHKIQPMLVSKLDAALNKTPQETLTNTTGETNTESEPSATNEHNEADTPKKTNMPEEIEAIGEINKAGVSPSAPSVP